MYAVLIVDGAGNVRNWTQGHYRYCQEWANRLPLNGYNLYGIVKLA